MRAALLAVAAILAAPMPTHAAGGGPGSQSASTARSMPDTAFRAVEAATLERLRKNEDERAQKPTEAGSWWGQGGLASLGETSSVNTIARAAAAIQTTSTGVKAGVTVAPLLLLGRSSHLLHPKITLASLDSGGARLVLALSVSPSWRPRTYEDIGLGVCRQDKAVRKEVEARRPAFGEVCEELVAHLPGPDQTAKRGRLAASDVAMLERGCGFAPGPKDQVPQLAEFGRALKRVTKALTAAPPDASLERRLARYKPSVDAIVAFKYPQLDACISDSDIETAYLQTMWASRRWHLGFAAQADTFPVLFGFNADPKQAKLSHGELGAWQGTVEYQYDQRRVQFIAGFGFGRSRPSIHDPFQWLLSPSLSLSYVLGGIGGDSLLTGTRKLRITNGVVVPQLVLGLSLKADISATRPSTQKHALHGLTAEVHLDFNFSKDLSFRLGIPVTGTLVTREATDPKNNTSDIQWSVPVTVATVLKL